MEKKWSSLDKNTVKKIAAVIAVVAIGTFALYKVNIFGTTEVKVAKVEVGALSDMNLYTGMVVPGAVSYTHLTLPTILRV